MQRKKVFMMFVMSGILVLVVSGIALASAQTVRAAQCGSRPSSALAQCGSQISSCKNCHEVQAKDPVNNDGKPWHTSHAFGDFCYICHGGNQQAADEVAAHAGLVPPLSDVKASCQSCHPNDLDARVQVYASALGVTAGTTANPPSASTPTVAPAAATTVATQPVAAALPAPASNNPDLVNYVQRYNENVLGQYPTNWGNVIALVLIGGMVLGGGVFILHREGWVRVSFREMKPIEKEYPSDVVELASEIAQLKPAARNSLHRLLGKPEAAGELLSAIDKLSTDNASEKN